MSRSRIEVPQLENLVGAGKKKFVRYAEGAALYSLGLHTFQEIATILNKGYRICVQEYSSLFPVLAVSYYSNRKFCL